MNKGKSAKSEKRTEVLIIVLFTIVALIIGGVIIVKNFSPSKPNLDGDMSRQIQMKTETKSLPM